MRDIKEAANSELDRRHSVWLDDENESTSARYRSGFVAGAAWAQEYLGSRIQSTDRSRSSHEEELASAKAQLVDAMAALSRLAAELDVARRTAPQAPSGRAQVKQDLERLRPMTEATHARVVIEVADAIDGFRTGLSPDGQAIVDDTRAAAEKIVALLLLSGARWRYWNES